ncbi:hypothetical protein, partial [Streptococcus oralis]|uniref:hypothetical protein n=1 Tax=Streptococcus oralis TaxID=1303 RepID=UPI001F505370
QRKLDKDVLRLSDKALKKYMKKKEVRKMVKKGLMLARFWLIVSIAAFSFYLYTMIYIFSHNMDDIFAPFVMFLIFGPLIPLFFMILGGLALFACIELAYRNLQRYK